jgi:hypothetical protein
VDPLALYAAALSTVLAGFQIYVWIEARRTKVRLSLGRYSNLLGVATSDTMGLTVRIRNKGGHTIHPAAAGYGSHGGDGKIRSFGINDDRVPKDVPPGETIYFNIAPEELDFDVRQRPITVWVRLSDGKIIQARRRRPID